MIDFYGLSDELPEIRSAYNEFVQKREAGLDKEKLAPYQYYNLPLEKSFCLTFDPNRADKTPPFTGAMGASLDVLSYRELLKKKSILDLWKIISMKIPMDKTTNKMTINYSTAAEIVEMIRAQMPENIVAYATPFESQEVSTNQVNTMDKLVDLGDNNVYSALGIGSAFFGKDNKNTGQINISSQIAFDFSATHMYTQFANLANWIIMQKTRTYKWKVTFFGNKMKENEEVNRAVNLVTQTNYPVEYLMASTGFEPFEVASFINWSNKLDLKSKMKPLQSMNTTSNKPGDEGGRPEKMTGELTESGAKSRDYNK